MAWPKEKIAKINRIRFTNLLIKTKKIYFGDETISGFGSIIHWDTLHLRELNSGRVRRTVLITCGKCGKDRWLHFDNLIRHRRKPTFSGLCQECWWNLTWVEKNRDHPLKYKPNKNGYMVTYVGKHHPLAWKNGNIYEHRLVMSEHLGRPLETWETVHHKDGNKINNALDNLELISNSKHYIVTRMRNRIKYLEKLLKHHDIPFR